MDHHKSTGLQIHTQVAQESQGQQDLNSFPKLCEVLFHPRDTKHWTRSEKRNTTWETERKKWERLASKMEAEVQTEMRKFRESSVSPACFFQTQRCLKSDESGTTGKDRSNKAQLCDLRHGWESRAERGKAEKTVRFLWALPCCVCSS